MAKSRTHKKRSKRWAFPVGLLITILAVVGLVTVIVAGVGVAKKAIDKAKNIDEYNKMLTPVVMNDPDTFDDITKANQSQLIDISIWSILKGNLSPDKYEYGDKGMIIPEADVTAEYEKLFGTDVPPVHATVNGYGYEFTYDAAQKTYSIPLTGVVPTFTPDVVNVQKKSGSIILTVGYLAGDQWAQNEVGDMVAPEPDKFMKVTLREKDGSYYISALQATSAPETASTAPSATAAPTTSPATTQQSSVITTQAPTEAPTQVSAE